jgi:hypothetical protein
MNDGFNCGIGATLTTHARTWVAIVRHRTSMSIVGAAVVWSALLIAASPTVAAAVQPSSSQGTDAGDAGMTVPIAETLSASALREIKDAVVRLPLAAVFGTLLALRPKRRGPGSRSVLVIQTQIMLAVVGAVIMLVVGNSLSRAFGIVGAAGLVRYRSTIADPKEAVVMLCALGAGLAVGVGLYFLGAFATLFMASLLWVIERFEATARRWFEVKVKTRNVQAFRPKIEGVMAGFQLEFDVFAESDDEVGYSVSAPMDVRTRDVSDTLRLLRGNDEMAIEWDEKKTGK